MDRIIRKIKGEEIERDVEIKYEIDADYQECKNEIEVYSNKKTKGTDGKASDKIENGIKIGEEIGANISKGVEKGLKVGKKLGRGVGEGLIIGAGIGIGIGKGLSKEIKGRKSK